jgi:GABA(A) receptor-associated protein
MNGNSNESAPKPKLDLNKPKLSPAEKQILKAESSMIKAKYPQHIPVVVRCDPKSDLCLSKHKFLVNNEVTIGQLMYIVRKKLTSDLHSTHALFMFVNNKLPPTSALISSVYAVEKDNDTDMLHIVLCKENTFGDLKNPHEM